MYVRYVGLQTCVQSYNVGPTSYRLHYICTQYTVGLQVLASKSRNSDTRPTIFKEDGFKNTFLCYIALQANPPDWNSTYR